MKLRIARIAAVPFWAVFFLPGCCRVSSQDASIVSAETVSAPQRQDSGPDKAAGFVRLSPILEDGLSLFPEPWNPGDSAVALAERLGETFLRYKWSDSRVPVRGHAISMCEILTGTPYESEFSGSSRLCDRDAAIFLAESKAWDKSNEHYRQIVTGWFNANMEMQETDEKFGSHVELSNLIREYKEGLGQ